MFSGGNISGAYLEPASIRFWIIPACLTVIFGNPTVAKGGKEADLEGSS